MSLTTCGRRTRPRIRNSWPTWPGELVAHKYDLKHIFRLILTSRTYQRSSRTTEWNVHDGRSSRIISMRRLPAESLADAVAQVTGSQEHYSSYVPQPHKEFPQGFRAIQLDDGSISSGFLAIFGRPQRDSPYEHSRVCRTSMAQELYLFNAQQLMDKIGKGQRISHWLAGKTTDERDRGGPVSERLVAVAHGGREASRLGASGEGSGEPGGPHSRT